MYSMINGIKGQTAYLVDIITVGERRKNSRNEYNVYMSP